MSIQEKIDKKAAKEAGAAYSKVWDEMPRKHGHNTIAGVDIHDFIKAHSESRIAMSNETLVSLDLDTTQKVRDLVQKYALLKALITQVEVKERLESAVIEIAELEEL